MPAVLYVVFFATGFVQVIRCLFKREWEILGIWAIALMSSLIGIGSAYKGVVFTWNGF